MCYGQIAKLFRGQRGFIQALVRVTGAIGLRFDEDMRVTGLSHAIAVLVCIFPFVRAYYLIVGKRRAPFCRADNDILRVNGWPVSSVLQRLSCRPRFCCVLLKRENDSLNALMLSYTYTDDQPVSFWLQAIVILDIGHVLISDESRLFSKENSNTNRF